MRKKTELIYRLGTLHVNACAAKRSLFSLWYGKGACKGTVFYSSAYNVVRKWLPSVFWRQVVATAEVVVSYHYLITF